MSLPSYSSAFGGLYPISSRGCEPYEPSIASAASSSQTSIFSDTGSEQSSIASSISDDFRHSQDEVRDRACAQAQLRHQLSHGMCKEVVDLTKADALPQGIRPSLTYADVTSAPLDQRQHPRRCSLARNQKPPSLQRQQDRKTHFVDSLVDSASQMVEVIWPLSVIPCKGEGASGRGVLPLRTYIEETLRRSRTSYSTLQVALYYLVLIRPFVPKNDFTQEQRMDCPANRALMCGRRMFLAALILASKYLQDRNYSAKAWSKMSGLSVTEINTNERTFLGKVDFKLHIADSIFTRWTEIVLKYTPNTPSPPLGHRSNAVTSWKGIIPLLTPALDTIPLPESSSKPKTCPVTKEVANYGCLSPSTPTPTQAGFHAPSSISTSQENTPTPATVLPPRFLEPKTDLLPPTPALARLGPLPTPQLTPSSVASSTPAVSACGSRRPSMCSAMALAQKTSFNRCAMDTYPFAVNPRDVGALSRRPSIMSADSSRSSPESMISDRSRSSRASSISSVSTISSTASLAPHRADLARQATCRKARLPMPPAPVAEEQREGTAAKPIVIADDAELGACSPEANDFSISEKKLHAPHKHTKFAPRPTSSASSHAAASFVGHKGCKRGRSHGSTRRSNLHEEVRMMLEEELEYDDDDDLMDLDDQGDDTMTSPSPAVDYATRLLSSGSGSASAGVTTTNNHKCVQPPAAILRHAGGPCRLPVPRHEGGNKRSCCSTAMSVSPAPVRLYGEVL